MSWHDGKYRGNDMNSSGWTALLLFTIPGVGRSWHRMMGVSSERFMIFMSLQCEFHNKTYYLLCDLCQPQCNLQNIFICIIPF